MIRSKTPKEDEDSENNLIGKSIVDPNGKIIGKCAGVIEDEKKKTYMKVTVTTDLNSEFIVEEVIPTSLINKVGEIILLKRAFTIQPIILEDIITFDLPVINSKELANKDDTKSSIINEELNEFPNEIENSIIEKQEPDTNENQINRMKYNLLLDKIVNEREIPNREKMISDCIENFQNNSNFRKDVQRNFFKPIITSDYNIRLAITDIFNKLCHSITPIELIPLFFEGLTACYNEPSFDIEEKLTEDLNFISTKLGDELLQLNFEKYFRNIILDRKICKNISLNRIHNTNLRIFANNFYIQDIMVFIYLQPIINNVENSEEYTLFLKEFNATIISYTLISKFGSEFWNILKENKIITSSFADSFMNSINNIHNIFTQRNIKKLEDIIDPKIGSDFSNDLIAIMVKNSLKEVLSNFSFLPIDTLCEYYSDPNNRIIQIIFDLINNSEINVEIIFVQDKTYIGLYN